MNMESQTTTANVNMDSQPKAIATFDREFFRRDERMLKIGQYEVGDVGCVVWDAAIVLSRYLETADFIDDTHKNCLFGKTVVELGAGTGIVGIQAAACGANSVITDLAELVPLIQANIDLNRDELRGSAHAEVLNWEEDFCRNHYPQPDYILLADCIYYEASVEPLFKTIYTLCSQHTVILCCYEDRLSGNKPELLKRFLELFKEEFVLESIPHCRHDDEYRSEDIHILRITKKS